VVARPARRESEAICPRSVGATSPEMSETNEINETNRAPGHGSGSRVGTNVGTNSQRWKSVLTLRLKLDPAVRFFLVVRKNLTEDGKGSPPARILSYGFAAERLLGGNSSYPCALLAYRAVRNGWAFRSSLDGRAITARMLLDGLGGPASRSCAPDLSAGESGRMFCKFVTEHSSQLIGSKVR